MVAVMNQIKRKERTSFSLKEISKTMNDLIKGVSASNSGALISGA
jgi:hypothetical protein